MRSIQAKTIAFNIIAISVSFLVATGIGAVSVAITGHESAEQKMALECENGKNKISYYIDSVAKAMNVLGAELQTDIEAISDSDFNTEISSHITRAASTFEVASKYTHGVFTYYYRMDPTITSATGEKGFWYVLNGNNFIEHEVTPLDSGDFECKWYFDTKAAKKPIWLEPYATDNLYDENSKEVYVISYNFPIKRHNEVIAVAGIEISYKTLGELLSSIKPFDSGVTFIISNRDASILYHPNYDVFSLQEEKRPQIPKDFQEAFKNGDEHIVYRFEGVKKHSFNLDNGNGTSTVVAVSQSAINKSWQILVTRCVLISVGVVAIFAVGSILLSLKITKPLNELTRAAEEINKGNYKVEISYKGDDEIGVLTKTFNTLIKNLDEYIGDLNALAYSDQLTLVGNKGAFDIEAAELQKQIDDPNNFDVHFALVMFDCDSLKDINDKYGHDKGDIYLRSCCNFMCRMFRNSKVYRIGGDEFVAILTGEDYINRFIIRDRFYERSDEICSFAKEPWEQIRVSIGIADYNPKLDKSVQDVLSQADHYMYVNKRERKQHQK